MEGNTNVPNTSNISEVDKIGVNVVRTKRVPTQAQLSQATTAR